MNKLLEFYNERTSKLKTRSTALKNKLINLGIVRFLVFAITCFSIYITFGSYLAVVAAFLGILLFTFFVFKYLNIKKEKAIVDEKITINTTEIAVLQRDFYHLDGGNEFVDPNHFFSNDVDLFGRGSFFQYINRTTTIDGKQALAQLLTSNDIDAILEKQKVIKELSEKVEWRQHFAALAKLFTAKNSMQNIIDWITKYTSVFPDSLKTVQTAFATISLLLIGSVSLGLLSFNFLLIWFFIGLFFTGFYLKKTNALYQKTDVYRETFKQYHLLLHEIEKEKFSSKTLNEKQQLIANEHEKASVIFRKFTKILDAFDNRNNIIIAVLGNGLFLWEVLNAVRVERWIQKYKHTLENWFAVVAYFDAQNSLANFRFNHPNYVFPEISKDDAIITSNELGHPLLDEKKRINNDFDISNQGFFIITGANMAGKSTFLRTVSLSIIMANCGLPVCATKFNYKPIKLITSMRTSDSLTEEASYFYAELKRLQFIVEKIKEENYFIILDEILKGTNSKDKAQGSKEFVKKLTQSKSTGIIATHDVSLCELANECASIKNYFFDADIEKDELYFDYKLKNGVCKNMNASFLLKKMKIID